MPTIPNQLRTLSDEKHNYHLVNSQVSHERLLNKLSNCDRFTFDTETASTESGSALTIHSLQLVGIAFAFEAGEAYYLPISEAYHDAIKQLQPYKKYFENASITKIGHNLKFDINVMRRYGISISGQLIDTMVAHYLIDSDKRHGLKELSRELLNYQQIEIQNLIGYGKTELSMRDIPLEEVSVYACEDADQTLQLSNILLPKLTSLQLNDLFFKTESPLIMVLADIEYTGINVDYETLLHLDTEAEAELERISAEIFELVGFEFKINSPFDLRELLFVELGLESKGKTKSGDESTGKNVLKKLKNDHPVIPMLLKYKATAAVKNSFLSKLPSYIHPDTERIHTSFNQAKVVTGRLSSSKPNLQNIPRQHEGFGREVRKVFIPSNENYVIVSADYSQIELRVIAHYSQDPVLIDAFNKDIDIHTATAAKIFNVPETDITKDDKRRKVAKTINFGLNYLMSAETLAERIAEETGEEVDVDKAKEYMASYFDNFVGVAKYHESSYLTALKDGYVTTLYGRRRMLPEIDSVTQGKRSKAKRLAANTPIQGTAADIIKIAMVRMFNELNRQQLKSKMVLQVHDELVFDVPKDELDKVIPLIRQVMESAATLRVPLKVDIGHGANWLDAH